MKSNHHTSINNTDNMQCQNRNQNIARKVACFIVSTNTNNDFGPITVKSFIVWSYLAKLGYAARKIYFLWSFRCVIPGQRRGMIQRSRLTAVFILAGQRFRGSREGRTFASTLKAGTALAGTRSSREKLMDWHSQTCSDTEM